MNYQMMAEKAMVKHFVTELYPSGIVSLVSDTFDLFRVLTDVLPSLVNDINKRQDVVNEQGIIVSPGKVVIRPDCYDSETKILTPRGWVYFKDLAEDDLVAQVLEDNSYEFVSPIKIINQEYTGDMYHFKDHHGKIDLLVTPNHRMILDQSGVERVVTAEALGRVGSKGNHKEKMWRTARAQDSGLVLTDEERLKIAFQADGSYVAKSNSSIRFNFAKQRKCDRLEDILDNLSYEYKVYNLSDGRVEYNIKVGDSSKFDKEFSWVNTTNLSFQWCVDFIEELSYWDATRRSDNRFKFDTTTPCVVPIIELIAIGAGYAALISVAEDNRSPKFSEIYTINIMKNNMIGGQARTKELVQYSGTVHCVQVPTGKVLVKRGRGTMVCGNSGDPVKILTGYNVLPEQAIIDRIYRSTQDAFAEGYDALELANGTYVELTSYGGIVTKGRKLSENEVKGVIQLLWDTFGGEVNEKGFKQLTKVGAIYGDSITLERAEQILQRLEAKGFASGNVVLGIGSYTYQYNTRDTYGMAVKATWGQIKGKPVEIFKDPITDDGTKKSLTGLLRVELDENGEYVVFDRQSRDQECFGELRAVFLNGKLCNAQSLAEIRELAKK